jgi:hypothetical protein
MDKKTRSDLGLNILSKNIERMYEQNSRLGKVLGRLTVIYFVTAVTVFLIVYNPIKTPQYNNSREASTNGDSHVTFSREYRTVVIAPYVPPVRKTANGYNKTIKLYEGVEVPKEIITSLGTIILGFLFFLMAIYSRGIITLRRKIANTLKEYKIEPKYHAPFYSTSYLTVDSIAWFLQSEGRDTPVHTFVYSVIAFLSYLVFFLGPLAINWGIIYIIYEIRGMTTSLIFLWIGFCVTVLATILYNIDYVANDVIMRFIKDGKRAILESRYKMPIFQFRVWDFTYMLTHLLIAVFGFALGYIILTRTALSGLSLGLALVVVVVVSYYVGGLIGMLMERTFDKLDERITGKRISRVYEKYESMLDGFSSEDPNVRIKTAEMIGGLGKKAKGVKPALFFQMLDEEDEQVKEAVITAIKRINRDSSIIRALLARVTKFFKRTE